MLVYIYILKISCSCIIIVSSKVREKEKEREREKEVKKKMGRNWGMPWSPKKEEQEVPDPDIITCSSVVSDNHCHRESNHTVDLHHPNKDYFSSFMDDMELDDDGSLFAIPADAGDKDDIKNSQAVEAGKPVVDPPAAGHRTGSGAYWDFEFTSSDHDGGLSSVNEDSGDQKPILSQQQEQDNDDDEYHQEMKMEASLNLSLNYQHVLDAWSDRRTLWARDKTAFSLPNNPNNHSYMGEVPVMDNEERSTRREASVMRYKEKRQTRLFSKKIRYQVRKLNAEKRPRLKGRFVRKASDRQTDN
ncbi:PREDICTED: uncharacterized protein LOC109182571 [Ipomoea nil]|uniref:uncharacterized protein LOC109182571 n=1 Tax=Ipomoea nil TaxID=35883 RepID=UPI000900E2A0|nr:PREDICTED: uncharacterized protein LOC109182571 [Ipomoea nil]